jgi:hypothetical protein
VPSIVGITAAIALQSSSDVPYYNCVECNLLSLVQVVSKAWYAAASGGAGPSCQVVNPDVPLSAGPATQARSYTNAIACSFAAANPDSTSHAVQATAALGPAARAASLWQVTWAPKRGNVQCCTRAFHRRVDAPDPEKQGIAVPSQEAGISNESFAPRYGPYRCLGSLGGATKLKT